MTKVINFADLRRPPVLILDVDGVKHPMKAASVDDFLFHIEVAEKAEKGLAAKEELLAMIEVITRAFPSLTEAQVRAWSPDEINQISVMARGGEVEISEEDASGNAPKAD